MEIVDYPTAIDYIAKEMWINEDWLQFNYIRDHWHKYSEDVDDDVMFWSEHYIDYVMNMAYDFHSKNEAYASSN